MSAAGMATALAVATAAMPAAGWRPAAVVVLAVWGLAYGALPVAMARITASRQAGVAGPATARRTRRHGR